MFKRKFGVKEIAFTGMLTALTVILGYVSGFLRVGNISKISISFIPVYISGAIFGPLTGGIVAATADIISYITNPTGVYLWQLTLIEFLYGFLFGIIFYRKTGDVLGVKKLNLKILLFSLIQLLLNMTLKTLVLMKAGFLPDNLITAMGLRAGGCFVAVILNFIFINLLEKFISFLIDIVRK